IYAIFPILQNTITG
ncbi:hypothetical protein MK373_09440, partial [Streptococcus oralis]|nr:hypothetical protein [Streptococcus oralis]